MSDYFDTLPNVEPFATIGGDVYAGNQPKYANENVGVTPQFFSKPIQNYAKSEAEGRPIFDDMLFCKILIAGDPFNAHVQPVDEGIKRRFSQQLREYLDTKTSKHIEGTPLREWPPMTPVKIAEFEALNIFTVEALANLPEVHLQRGFDLRAWKEKARGWLEQAKDGSTAARLAGENERMRDRIGELEGQINDLSAKLTTLLKAQDEERAARAERKRA